MLAIAAAAILIAAAAALIDWRFWYRWYTLPDDPGEWPASYHEPAVEIHGDPGPFFPLAPPGARSIDEAALEAAVAWAETHSSAALLVQHRGVVQLECYWQGIGPDSLFPGRAMTRSLIPPLIADALADGKIRSLDDPVGRYLPKWRDDARGRITLRQLLWNLSGQQYED